MRTTDRVWPYQIEHSQAIAAAWEERLARAPHFWNGTVLLLRVATARIVDGELSGEMWVTDFKSFVHWRDSGRPEADAFDCFGSIILRSAEGHVLLGRQRKGMNAGLVYLPSGVVDEDDVREGGRVDIDGSIARELDEETGLDIGGLSRVPGFVVAKSGNQLAIGAVFDAERSSVDLRDEITARLDADPDAELAEVIIVRSPADLAPLAPIRYSELLVTHVMTNGGAA